MFERKLYIDRIKPFINKKIIKVLTGQRRVGKSVLLELIAEEIKIKNTTANFIFIDKEEYEFDLMKTHNELMEYIQKHKSSAMNYVFIDEIQEIEGFERVLRSLYKKENFDIYCTGSNAKMFSGELATFLSGRQIIIQIGSLNFNEFCQFHRLEAQQETLLKYLKYGGLPFLIHLPDNEKVRYEYLNNIFSTILLRDVVNRHQLRDSRFLNDLLKFLADNVGSLFSASKIAKFLKSQQINKSVSVILNYLSFLEEAFFLNKIERFDIKGKKQFEVGEKYYFEDIGLRNSVVGFKMQDIAKIIENVVFLHLRNHGYDVKIGSYESKEIDFVAFKNNEKVYFQVCYLLVDESTIQPEFGNLLEIKDNYPKYVVSYDTFSTSVTYEGITHLTLLEFLTQFS